MANAAATIGLLSAASSRVPTGPERAPTSLFTQRQSVLLGRTQHAVYACGSVWGMACETPPWRLRGLLLPSLQL